MYNCTNPRVRLLSLLASSAICIVLSAVLSAGCKKDSTSTNNPPDTTSNPSRPFGVFTETHNRGGSWSDKDSLLFARNVYGGTFTLTANIFVVVGQDTAGKAAIWTSTDNGFHWSSSLTTSSSGAFEDVTHTQGYARLVAVGDNGIYWSTNNGLAWTLRTGAGNLKAIDFFEGSDVGVAVGLGGVIHRSLNSGSTWAPVSSGTTQDLFGVHCIASSDTIIAVGAAATVVRSTDAGATWTATTLSTATILKAVSFSGNSTGRYGITVGNGGVRFRSTDGGVSWQDRSGNASGNYEDVRVSDDGSVCLAVFNQTAPHTAFFFSSNDEGRSWGSSGSVHGAYVLKIVFRTLNASDPYGFAVGVPNR
jgi:photosystem II stability/assembly factor-like uncharacterized protein